MRILIIILSSFASQVLSQVLVFHAGLILRLNELIERGAEATEAVVWVSSFRVWTLATALVSTAPSVVGWLFASAGVLGLFIGASTDDRLLIVWGGVASGLAVLTTLVRREQRLADQRDRHRAQQDIAVYLAMRSLQETVPELLARLPDGDPGDAPTVGAAVPPSVPNGLAPSLRCATVEGDLWSVGWRGAQESAQAIEALCVHRRSQP